jgi:CRISPR/Cas system CMR-associated protein Cmr5 small subunit
VLEVTVANCTNPTVGGTIAAAQSGNNPFTPAAFTSSVAASGQTGIIEYKWQSSTSSNTTGFNDIASSNTATYTPGALTVTTWFKRLARVSCKSDWTGAAESNVLEITVTNCTNPTVGGIIATAQSGTNPFTPSAFTSSLAASGETGTLEYKWQSSTTSNSAGFNDIASSNTATYTPGALTVTTWFKRLARVSCKSDWTGAAESNVLEVTIVTLATQPLTQPTNLFFTNTGTSSPYNIVSNFTASTAAGYIVVRKTGTAPSFVPVDGTSYSVGAQGSDEIVYVGSLTSATDYAVTDALSYYYTIYAYNGSGGSINYLTTNPLSGKAINKASNSEAIGNTTQATSVGFPTAGVNISFPNGTSGSTISATKANSIPTSNFSVLPGVRGVVNQYFSITSSNANPGTYTLILDFSSLGLTNGAWNNFKILKRANTTSPWVNITDLGATIANRQTDGIWGKFTITGLTSFSQFTGGAANSTITVTSAAETGTGSLKQAIIDATDGDLINFDVSAMGGNTITLTSQVVINKDLTIQGINGGIILDGNNATRVMDIADTKVVRLERLKIVNGNGNVGYAGGIWNNGDLTMVNCVVSGNKETGNLGVGGILQFSDTGDDPDDVLNLVNCTITANDGTSAVYDDGIGGLSVINGTANIYNTIVYGNTGDGFGDIDQTTVITEIKNSCIGNLSLVTLTNPGVGNIATNPGFVGAIVNATHPYAITNTSPAADAGDNAYNFDATDIRGGAFGRTINKTDGTSGTIDMGAYEFSGCVNPTVGGTIAAAQNGVTPFNPAAFTSTVAASGQSGTVEYKWQSSITSNSAGFSDIASSNADTYDAGALTVTTWYKRLARVTCSADWTGAAESNVIEVTVVSLLPVTGIELGGTASDKQVKLSFKALNEHEMASYTIERSADGTSFTNIGSLQASNANQASASYSFTDNQPIVGNNYYRIKGSSINGQIQYSNVVVVKYGVHVSSVAVVPNPIEGKTLKLKVSQLAKGNYHINVIDALGRSVFKKEMLLDGSGLVQLNLPISAKAGNYYVKVDGQGTVFVQAFIIR